jgi:hypothetical protein
MSGVMTTAEMVAADLRRYGEDETAEWILSCTDEELERVCRVAGFTYYQVSPSAKACSVAAVYVHEGAPRELRRKRRKPLTEPEGPLLHNGRYTSMAVRALSDPIGDYGVEQDLIDYFSTPGAPARRSHWTSGPVIGARWRKPEFGERDDRRTRWCAWFPDELEGRIRRSVAWVGTESFGLPHTFYSVFPLLPDAEVGEVPEAVEFIQTTGLPDRLMVEIKRREPDGGLRQYIIGRSSEVDGDAAPAEVVNQGEHVHLVHPHEVHSTAAVQDLFAYYLHHRDVSPDSSLRELPEFYVPGNEQAP